MSNIVKRNVKKEDLWDVSSIVVEGWKTAYRGIIDDEFLDSLSVEEKYNKRLTDYDKNGFIVTEIDNKVVGFCRYTTEKLFSKQCEDIDCELSALYVKPDLKGNGIGTALFKYVVDKQIKNGNKSMIIWCLKENYKSRKFYEKMGGILYGENEIERGGKKYKEVGYRYAL